MKNRLMKDEQSRARFSGPPSRVPPHLASTAFIERVPFILHGLDRPFHNPRYACTVPQRKEILRAIPELARRAVDPIAGFPETTRLGAPATVNAGEIH